MQYITNLVCKTTFLNYTTTYMTTNIKKNIKIETLVPVWKNYSEKMKWGCLKCVSWRCD